MGFVIETERLVLRDVRMGDLPVLVEQLNDPAARDFVLSSLLAEADIRADIERSLFFAGQQPRHHYNLAVMLRGGDAVIGACSLYNAVPEGIEAVMGLHLDSRYRGRGYAPEAARRLLHIGFELNEVSRIQADCFAHNEAAMRVLEKIGMTRRKGGGVSQWWRARGYGEQKPIVRYQVWRDEWVPEEAA